MSEAQFISIMIRRPYQLHNFKEEDVLCVNKRQGVRYQRKSLADGNEYEQRASHEQ